ncbi:RNA binding protein, heterogenous nuclear RNP-K like protein [Rhizophlyctis rosea]|nr:RNA binding protein, heterogenous nuclear RNP-K like protein [Rhizophlyctis rosea]
MSLHAATRPAPLASNVDRRSSPYDDDPMVRLTGLSLDPDFPPTHQQSKAPRDSDNQSHDQPQSSSSASGASRPAARTGGSSAPTGSADAGGEAGNEPGEGDQNDDEHAQHGGPGEHEGAHDLITLRALVSSREAGVIIGKGGKNVAEVREKAGVKAGVSKVVQGVHERILTVSGQLHNVSQVIGKQGGKIREIQEESGAKIVVSKELLPQSTERVIDIYGLADSMQIGECILNDIDRSAGTILYTPQPRTTIRTSGLRHDEGGPLSGGVRERRRSSLSESPASAQAGHTPTSSGGRRFSRPTGNPSNGSSPSSATRPSPSGSAPPADEGEPQTLAIPADMIGCIIGKGGSFINQIRRLSGARLRIDEVQEGQTERVVTISGSEAATKKALSLLYNQLDAEKQRRLAGGHGGRDGADFEGGEL